MKLVYVSHPYTGDEKKNVKKVREYCRILKKDHPGWCLFNPLDNMKFAHGCGLSHDDYMAMDMEVLARCDIVVFCGHWKKSRGCRMEYEEAKRLGVDVMYFPETCRD